MKKLLSIIMVLVIAMTLFAACSAGDVAVTVGKEEVKVGEATFVLRELEAMYEQQYGADIWQQGFDGKTFDEIIKEGAIDSVTRLYVSKNVANERGMTLSTEEEADIDALMEEYLKVTTEDMLTDSGITVEDVKSIFTLNAIGEKLMEDELVDFEVDQESLDAALANDASYQQIQKYGFEGVLEQVTAQHILISLKNEDGTDKSDEDKALALATAEEVLQKAKDGEAFDGLVADYSEDPGWTENGGTYTFYRGEMVAAFEDSAFGMEIGEISDLVESSFGYHIITKIDHTYPEDEQVQNVKDYQDYVIEQYTLTQKQAEFDKLYEEWKVDYDVKVNEKVWEKVLTSNQIVNGDQ